jgi:hypothetical protein
VVVCRELIPVGSVLAFLAEHRRVLFPPEAFVDMYAPVNRRPSVPPDLLATVVALQALHGAAAPTITPIRASRRSPGTMRRPRPPW